MSMLNEDHAEALAELLINNDFKPTNDGQKELLRKFKKHPSFKGYEITVNRFVATNASLGSVIMKAAYDHTLDYSPNPYASGGKNEFAEFLVPYKKITLEVEQLKKKIIETYDRDTKRYKFIDVPNLKGQKTVKEIKDEYYETHDPIGNKEFFLTSFYEKYIGLVGFFIGLSIAIFVLWFFIGLITDSEEPSYQESREFSKMRESEIKDICQQQVMNSGIEYRCETRSCIAREVEKELALCISRNK